MDRSDYFLLGQLKKACSQRTNGSWELLATAAGNPHSLSKTLQGLALDELKLEFMSTVTFSPSIVEERVEALSVSRPDLLRHLLAEWEVEVCQNQLASENVFITRAISTARTLFTVDQVDPNAEPWLWNEHLNVFSPNASRSLAHRPIINQVITLEDIKNAIPHGGGVIRALRGQNIQLEESIFTHYAQLMNSTSSYILSLLIELSRQTSFNTDIWIEHCLDFLPKTSDPYNLTPMTYSLLNPSWYVW